MPESAHPAEGLVHRGHGHVEFFDLSAGQLRELDGLLAPLAAEGRRRFSFHAPIVRPPEFPHPGVTCFFLCEDEAKRERSFALLASSLAEARKWGAAYVVTHLTFGPSDSRDASRATALAREACARMAELSAAAGVPLDVEFAAYSEGFHEPALFAEVVGRHAGALGVCIDVGHVFLGARRRGRDYLADIATLAPLARSMHLWNTRDRAGEGGRNGHVPLHPSQRPQEGWIDIEAVFDLLAAKLAGLSLVFEYPVARVTREIEEGYAWIAELASGRIPARIRTEAPAGSS